MARKKKAKRQYLNDCETKDSKKEPNGLFEKELEIPRIKVGKKQTIETLINEETLLFAKYLRNKKETWVPRITR